MKQIGLPIFEKNSINNIARILILKPVCDLILCLEQVQFQQQSEISGASRAKFLGFAKGLHFASVLARL